MQPKADDQHDRQLERPDCGGLPNGQSFRKVVQPDASRINVLDVPEPRVIDAVQSSWEFVKKQADILILIDTSGSMEEDNKIEQAKEAALAFLEATEPTNRVGLAVFDDDFRLLVPIDILETNRSRLEREIDRINADPLAINRGGEKAAVDASADAAPARGRSPEPVGVSMTDASGAATASDNGAAAAADASAVPAAPVRVPLPPTKPAVFPNKAGKLLPTPPAVASSGDLY